MDAELLPGEKEGRGRRERVVGLLLRVRAVDPFGKEHRKVREPGEREKRCNYS